MHSLFFYILCLISIELVDYSFVRIVGLTNISDGYTSFYPFCSVISSYYGCHGFILNTFPIWRKFPQFPQFPKPENQGFSTVPDYQSLKIVPIFGSMLHF